MEKHIPGPWFARKGDTFNQDRTGRPRLYRAQAAIAKAKGEG